MTVSCKSRYTSVLAALGFALIANVAHAGPTTCSGIVTGTFDNLVVPAGDFCFLNGSVVKGNIKARSGAVLSVEDSTIKGNVNGDHAAVVQLVATEVHGNVSVVGAGSTDPLLVDVLICASQIGGNVKITDSGGEINVGYPAFGCAGNVLKGNVTIEDNDTNAPDELVISENAVGKNMEIKGNKGSSQKSIRNNTVNGNLTCSHNDAPLVVNGNTARKLTGQCKP